MEALEPLIQLSGIAPQPLAAPAAWIAESPSIRGDQVPSSGTVRVLTPVVSQGGSVQLPTRSAGYPENPSSSAATTWGRALPRSLVAHPAAVAQPDWTLYPQSVPIMLAAIDLTAVRTGHPSSSVGGTLLPPAHTGFSSSGSGSAWDRDSSDADQESVIHVLDLEEPGRLEFMAGAYARTARPERIAPPLGSFWASAGAGGLFHGPTGRAPTHGSSTAGLLLGHGILADPRNLDSARLIALQASGLPSLGLSTRLNPLDPEPAAREPGSGRSDPADSGAPSGIGPAPSRRGAVEAAEEAARPAARGLGELLFLDPARLGELANHLLGSLGSYSDTVRKASEQSPAALGSHVSWLLVVLGSALIHEEAKRRRRGRKLGVDSTSRPEPIPNWLP